MARKLGLLVIGTLVSAGLLAYGCSSDKEEDDLQGGDPQLEGVGEVENTDENGVSTQVSTPDSVSPEVFQTPADADGDGVVTSSDILTSGAGVAVEESDVEHFQESSCAAWQVEPEPLAASLFFVVDASSSMDATAVNTGGVDKWTVTRDAIADAIRAMPDESQVGLLGYPNMVVGAQCVNEGAIFEPDFLGTAREELLAALEQIETETCTPTYDAYTIALNHFLQVESPGQKYMLLMTDGQPTIRPGCLPGDGTCSASVAGDTAMDEVIQAVKSARDQGVMTFILGSPGSEEHMETGLDNRWWLSQAAEVGGTAKGNCSHSADPYCHYDMTVVNDFAAGLADAMGQILGQVANCDYAIPPPDPGQLIDLSAIHLVLVSGGVDYIEVYQSASAECTHGWYLQEVDGQPRVRLCSATCDIVQADPLMELQWLFGCGRMTIGEDIT